MAFSKLTAILRAAAQRTAMNNLNLYNVLYSALAILQEALSQ
jgi:hypothetical protein